MVDAIVLAGGASTRFGADKLAATLDGRPLLAHAVEAAAGVAGRVIVVMGPNDPDPRILGAELVRDRVAHRGPLAGLATGLEALRSEGQVLVLGGDMPRADVRVLALLAAELEAVPVAVTYLESEPVHPLPMAVRPDIVLPAAGLLLAVDRRSLRGLLDVVPSIAIPAARWRALDPTGRTLRDIDTPEELDEA